MAKKKSNKQLLIMLALIAIIIAIMIFLPSCSGKDDTTLINKGDKAPDFTVEMFDGSKTSLSELGRGKVVLLNFWATWCPPCQQELMRVQTDIIDRFAGKDFVFLPISREETRQAVEAFREKNGYTFPMGLDTDRKIYDMYASNFIPRNFLIGKNGKVIFASIGYEPEEFDQLIEKIEKTLE